MSLVKKKKKISKSSSKSIPAKLECCHGCNGKGWVDSQLHGAQLCPICNGSGKIINRDILQTPWKTSCFVATYHIPE